MEREYDPLMWRVSNERSILNTQSGPGGLSWARLWQLLWFNFVISKVLRYATVPLA